MIRSDKEKEVTVMGRVTGPLAALRVSGALGTQGALPRRAAQQEWEGGEKEERGECGAHVARVSLKMR